MEWTLYKFQNLWFKFLSLNLFNGDFIEFGLKIFTYVFLRLNSVICWVSSFYIFQIINARLKAAAHSFCFWPLAWKASSGPCLHLPFTRFQMCSIFLALLETEQIIHKCYMVTEADGLLFKKFFCPCAFLKRILIWARVYIAEAIKIIWMHT